MTQIIAHLVNCLVIDSDDGFDEVQQCYESLLPATDFAEITEVIQTGYTVARLTPSAVAIVLADPPLACEATSATGRAKSGRARPTRLSCLNSVGA